MVVAGEEEGTCPIVTLDPFADDFLRAPYRYHATLRDAGALFWLKAHGVFGMARHAEVSAALKDWQTYSSARGVGLTDFARETPWRPPSLLLETDPPVHDRTRGLMNRITAFAGLKALRDSWRAQADDLVGELVERGSIDAVADLAEAFPLRIFPDLIGLRPDGRENLILYATASFNAFGPRNALFEESNARAATAIAWVADACKRENLSDGGWGMEVYRAADAGDCSHEEAERLVRSFLSAGVDTTVNGIANMIHAFATHPDQWQRLRADPSLATRAFEESLRWDSTVQTFFRTTTRAVEVGEHRIPEGAKILLFLAAANRDPRRWTDADRFDIGRSASGHVGFGYGIHQCLGQMVARQEAAAILEAMLESVKHIVPTGVATRRLNNTLHAFESIPVRFDT